MESNKKTTNKVLNIISIVVGVLVLIIAISAIASSKKGYTSIFGTISYAVKTESMVGDNKDSFNKGDIIFIKELKDNEKNDLKVGDVITFSHFVLGKPATITHRIIKVNMIEGVVDNYVTKGDNNNDIYDDNGVLVQQAGTESVVPSKVIGKYVGKIPFIGNISLLLFKPVGFLIVIVIPSILLVAYCVYIVIKNYKVYSEDKKSTELEAYKQKLLKEFQESQARLSNQTEVKNENIES